MEALIRHVPPRLRSHFGTNFASGKNTSNTHPYSSIFFQKLSPPPDANLDYADADYKDLYEFGPLSYKAASREAAEAKNKAAANKTPKKPPPEPSTNGKAPASPPQE